MPTFACLNARVSSGSEMVASPDMSHARRFATAHLASMWDMPAKSSLTNLSSLRESSRRADASRSSSSNRHA